MNESGIPHSQRPARRYTALWPLLTIAMLILALTPALANRVRRPAAVDRPPTLLTCLRRTHRPCLSPSEMAAFYGVDALHRRGITGQGRRIAIVVSFGSPTLRADLHAFDAAFGLPDPQLDILMPLGAPPHRATGWAGETTLDVEWTHAIAPGARIVVLVSPVDETEGTQGLPEFLALERYALRYHLADVISQSWAATEDTLFDTAGRDIVRQFHSFYQQAAAQGVTAVAATGDEGAAGPDRSVSHLFPYPVVGYPASDPLVLAVGGTRLLLGDKERLSGETTWAGGGGGVSKFFTEPEYQQALPAAAQRLLGGFRGIPDVSYNAALESPILIYERGRWGVSAGTSASTPQWAGLVALADGMAGHGLGSINAALYRLAASSRYAALFRDITTGGIAAPRSDGSGVGGIAFHAGPGWDAATGLGAPRAAELVPALAAVYPRAHIDAVSTQR